MTCSNPNCQNPAKARYRGSEERYCNRCLNRLYRHDTLDVSYERSPNYNGARCSTEGCNRAARWKGKCGRCQQRIYNPGQPGRVHRLRESGNGSRAHVGLLAPVEFRPRNKEDRETCLETLTERGVKWAEDKYGTILWWEQQRETA
jgi:hypothetical protein